MNNAPAPGLSVSVLGGGVTLAPNGLRAYSPAPSYALMEFQMGVLSTEGPGHLVMSLNNDVYVLPNGYHLVQKLPPSIKFHRDISQLGAGYRVQNIPQNNTTSAAPGAQ